ncbi:response regulator [Dongia sp.]|uniref:response regulator n=1 Tax=Dongia sp. TaxID=1977262 RepID=UPI0035AF322B
MRVESDEIINNIKYLRRYARAVTGSQESGDQYVRACLEAILADRELLPTGQDVKRGIFRLFHQIARGTPRGATDEDMTAGKPRDLPRNLSVDARLQALPMSEREILLLTSIERFSHADAAYILDVSPEEIDGLLAAAWKAVNEQLATSVLIIEDEPIIALDIAALVTDLGHEVVASVASQSEAIAVTKNVRPGLILADIDLGAGGSGIAAVKEILRGFQVPVIFVTAYPERLLTGERPEPTFLVTKPFDIDTLKVTISQALSFATPEQPVRAAI